MLYLSTKISLYKTDVYKIPLQYCLRILKTHLYYMFIIFQNDEKWNSHQSFISEISLNIHTVTVLCFLSEPQPWRFFKLNSTSIYKKICETLYFCLKFLENEITKCLLRKNVIAKNSQKKMKPVSILFKKCFILEN